MAISKQDLIKSAFKFEEKEKEHIDKQEEKKKKAVATKKAETAKNKEQDLIGAKDAHKLANEKARKEIRENKENNVSNSFSKARQFQTASAKAVSSEAEKQPMSATQYGKNQLSNLIYDKYRAAEEYYNNPYGNSLEKGLMNRLRSAGGETVENIAYFLKDNLAPETGYTEGDPITLENRDAAKRAKLVSNPLNQFLYQNAQNVTEKNTAGEIGDLADQQIMAAKENTGDFGDLLIDAADAGANMASQGILSGIVLPGVSGAFAATQGISAGGQKYRDTRENGGSQQEAFQRGLASAVIGYATEKIGGIGKSGVSKIPGVNRVVTHLDEFGTKNWLTNVLSVGLQEGGEEGLEYAFEYASDVLADKIYKGEVETEFNVSDLFHNVLVGFITGAGFGTVNYNPNAKPADATTETNPPTEPPVSPAEAPIAEAENVTPETTNEQEGAFANAARRIKQLQDDRYFVEVTLKNLEGRDPVTVARDRVVWDEKLERINNEIESIIREVSPEALEPNAQVNSTDDAIEPANDVIESANAQPRAQENIPQEMVAPKNRVVKVTPKKVDIKAKTEETYAQNGAHPNTVGGMESNPNSYSYMQKNYGTYPEGEKASRVIDSPVSTDGTDQVNRYNRTMQEAEVTPEELIPAFEKAVEDGVFSYKVETDKDALEYARDTIKNKGYSEAIGEFAGKVDGEKRLSKKDLAVGEVLYAQAAQMGDAKTAMRLASSLAQEFTKAGQAVQAARLLKKLTPEGKLYNAQRLVDRLNNNENKPKGQKDIAIDEKLATDLLAAQTEQEIEAAEEAIKQNIADQIVSTKMDKWNAWRYLSMLGNPKTHIRNVLGNAIFVPARVLKNGIKATIEKGYAANHKGYVKTTTVSKPTEAQIKAAEESFERNAKHLASGGNYRFESELESKQTVFKNKVLEGARKFNNKALEAEDMFFLKRAYKDSFARYLRANNIDPAKATAEQIANAENYAQNEAWKATYRDASKIATAFEKFSRTNKETKVFFDAILPFRKTPINILARGVEYSPAELLKAVTYDAVQVKNGKMEAQEMIDHISSGLTGTGIVALGAWLASMGLISGGDNEDEKLQNFEELQGKQNYALKIGDYSYTLDWAAPISLPLFVGVEAYNAFSGGKFDTGDIFSAVIDAIGKTADPMIGLSMLQNIESILSGQYGGEGNGFWNLLKEAGMSYVLQAFPTLGSQIAQTIDPNRRNAYYIDKTNKVPDLFELPLNRILAKIPGASYLLPERVDEWGRTEKQEENMALRIFENFASPGYISKDKSTDVDKVLKQLYAETGESSVFPTSFPKNLTVDGNKKDLSSKEYVEASKVAGQTKYDMLDQLIKREEFKKLPATEQAKIVKDIYSFGTVKGKQEVSNYVPDSKWYGNLEKAKEEGVSPTSFLLAKNFKGNIVTEKGGKGEGLQMYDYLIADKKTDAKQDLVLLETAGGVDMSKYRESSSDPENILSAYNLIQTEQMVGGDGTQQRIIKQLIANKNTTAKEDMAFVENVLKADMSNYKSATKNDKEALDFYMAKADSSVNKEGDIAAFVKKGYSAEEALAKYNVGSGSKTYEGGKFKGFSDKQLAKANKVKAKGHSSSTIAKAASAVTSLGSYGTKKTYASYVKALEAVGITDKKFQQDFWNIYM